MKARHPKYWRLRSLKDNVDESCWFIKYYIVVEVIMSEHKCLGWSPPRIIIMHFKINNDPCILWPFDQLLYFYLNDYLRLINDEIHSMMNTTPVWSFRIVERIQMKKVSNDCTTHSNIKIFRTRQQTEFLKIYPGKSLEIFSTSIL